MKKGCKGCVILIAAALAIFACAAVGYAGNNAEWFSTAVPSNNHEIRIGANPVNPQTVKSLQQARMETGGEVFFTGKRLFINDMQSGNGKIVTGWVPAGKAVLMEKVAETGEYVEHRSIFIGECGNGTRQIHRREYFTRKAQWGQHNNQYVAPQPVPQPPQQLVIAPVRVYRVARCQRPVWPMDVWVQGPFGPQRLSGHTAGPNPWTGTFYPNVWQGE